MQRHRRVEVGFRRFHLHGNGNALDHLGRRLADDVTTQHAVTLGLDDDLHEDLRIAARHRRLHRPELGP